jgi:protocatechuate 4,5-dioxygenase, beta chain
MAKLVSIVAATHDPFAPRVLRGPRSEWGDYVKLAEGAELLRDKLARARPDVLLTLGNDHFHHLFYDNMPLFLVGRMDLFDITYYNEVREFGLTRESVPGAPELSGHLIEGCLDNGVDVAYSLELKLDHSILVPLFLFRPELDLPIAPFLTNCIAPPLPPARRYFEVGRVIRAVIDAIPGDLRVGVVSTGHLSLDVGGPDQFATAAHDPDWDDRAVGWIATGEIEEAIAACTPEQLMEKGNLTMGYLNFLLTAGVADGLLPTHAEAVKRSGSSQALFAWEPETA